MPGIPKALCIQRSLSLPLAGKSVPKPRPKVRINKDSKIRVITGASFDKILLGEVGEDSHKKEVLVDESDLTAAGVEWYALPSDPENVL